VNPILKCAMTRITIVEKAIDHPIEGKYNWNILENQIGRQLLKQLLTFYITRHFITMFMRTGDKFLYWARWNQRTAYPICLLPGLILPSRLCLGSSNTLHPSGFPYKKCIYITFLVRAICLANPWFDHRNKI
jgi:hypothetical protein